MHKVGPILFCGYRAKAIRAAKKLGIPFGLVLEKPLKKTVGEIWMGCRPFMSNEAVDESVDKILLDNIRSQSFSAVIGLTESSVLLAAKLREKLSLQGNSFVTAKLCRDKVMMKRWAQDHSLNTPNFFELTPGSKPSDLEGMKFPVYIKERSLSGSRGLKKIVDRSHIPCELPHDGIVESEVDGVERSVEIWVLNSKIQFLNVTDYYESLKINIVPAQVSKDLFIKIGEFAEKVIRVFGIKQGMVHLEYFENDQKITFGECAVRAPGGFIMDLIQNSYGFNPWEAWIYMELGKPFQFPMAASKVSAAVVIHPGAGKVAKVDGWDQIKKLDFVFGSRLKLKVGDQLALRLGSGQNYGSVLLESADHAGVVSSIEEFKNIFKIKLKK